MFERFTDRARRVVVLAQEEARLLNHSYIGTEHLLLGIMREPESCAARSLAALQCTPEMVRAKFIKPDTTQSLPTAALRERAICDLTANLSGAAPAPEVLTAVADAMIKAGWRPQS